MGLTTKDYSRLAWLSGLMFVSLLCHPVTTQGNTTEAVTGMTVATSALETNYTSDATVTSPGADTPTETTEIQTEWATEIKTETETATVNQEEMHTEMTKEVTMVLESLTMSQEVNLTTASSANDTVTSTPRMDVLVNHTVEPSENTIEIFTPSIEDLVNRTTQSAEITTDTFTPNSEYPVNHTTQSSAENASETFGPSTEAFVNQTTPSSDNDTDAVTSNMESFENQTNNATDATTVTQESTGLFSENGSAVFLPANTTAVPWLSTAAGNTTVVPSTTDDGPHLSKQPPHAVQSAIVPILIFMALLFLLTIMIFIVLFAKSRIKRSLSTYNLTPAANGNTTQIGYRNTAFEQGDLADDTDVECSMRELRLEGKPTNGITLQRLEGFEEELTPL